LQKTNRADKVGELLFAELKRELRQEKNLSLGEVAGRDSAAAIIKAASLDSIDAILPTIVYTGTEYGSWETVFENVSIIRDRVESNYKKRFYDAVLLGDAELWWALNGRFLSVLIEKFGFYSPCLGCHLYMHLVRVPLARELNCQKIISGERIKHDNQIKVNQTSIVLDAYKEILYDFGLEIIFPVREISSGSEINVLVGGNWDEGAKQLKCVFRGNYKLLTDEVFYDERKVKKYLSEFIIPVGKKILGAWDKKEDLNYIEIVRSVLADSR
jgi:hypothetical protein